MKAVLVNPFQERLVAGRGRVYNRTWTPLDLATTAAVLRARGIEAAIVDANAERLGPAETAARCAGFDRAFVTSTSLDRWQCPHLDLAPFLATFAAVKAAVPEAYVLGSHGTVRPAEMLALTGARAVVRGEPEGVVSLALLQGRLERLEAHEIPQITEKILQRTPRGPRRHRPELRLRHVGFHYAHLPSTERLILASLRGCRY